MIRYANIIYLQILRAGLNDPGRAADASQMLTEEARRVTAALNDEERFSLTRPSGGFTAACADRVEELTALVAPMVEGAAELGARGTSSDVALATQLVSSLAREGFASRGGVDLLIALRKLPAVHVMIAGAMGATATRNGQMFAAFAAAPRLELYNRMLAVTSVLSPWDPFGPGWELPQFIVATREGGTVTNEVLAAYDAGTVRQIRSTPASDLVRAALEPAGRRFTVGDPEFKELFHRTEVMIAATTIDTERDNGGNDWSAQNWVGGHTAGERYAAEGLAHRMLAELETDGARWWPVAGGVFGGAHARAHAAMSTYVTMAVEAGKRRPPTHLRVHSEGESAPGDALLRDDHRSDAIRSTSMTARRATFGRP